MWVSTIEPAASARSALPTCPHASEARRVHTHVSFGSAALSVQLPTGRTHIAWVLQIDEGDGGAGGAQGRAAGGAGGAHQSLAVRSGFPWRWVHRSWLLANGTLAHAIRPNHAGVVDEAEPTLDAFASAKLCVQQDRRSAVTLHDLQ
eukprot:1105520-Prymnesium_polylepis.2